MVSVRDYQESDAPEVGVLIAETYAEYNLSEAPPEERTKMLGPFAHAHSDVPAHREAIAKTIASHWVYVAEDGGSIVGVLRGKPGRLQSLFVRGDHHRQGIGGKLVRHFESACLAEGVDGITLAATVYAVPFYQEMGYSRSTGLRNLRSFDGRGGKYQPMRRVLSAPRRV